MNSPTLEVIPLSESKRLITLEETIKRGLATFIEVGEALLEIRDSRLYRIEFSTFEEYCKTKWGMSRVQAHRLIGAGQVVSLLPVGNKPATERQARPLTKLKTPEQQRKAWQKAVEASPTGQPTAREVEAAVNGVQSLPGQETESVNIPETAVIPGAGSIPSLDMDEGSGESNKLFQLKNLWLTANKRDKAAFIKFQQEKTQPAHNPEYPPEDASDGEVGLASFNWAHAYADNAIDQLKKIPTDDPQRVAAGQKVIRWINENLI